ncbi:CBS domain-containing protein [Myxococcota bacterium]|nr:CBS domain-containing protein [Myxococcota bacterium]
MIVRSHMVDAPVFARPADPLRAAHQRMLDHDIHHLPVVDEGQRVIGIVSEHDLVVPRYLDRQRTTPEHFVLTDDATVGQAMTPDPVTLRASDSLKQALDLLLGHRFSALPVVDAEGRLVGMLTTKDLLLLLRDQLG